MRTTIPVALIGIVLALALLGAPSASADDGDVSVEWSNETTHLDWTGAPFTSVETSFLGNRTVSPGDHVTRTVEVRNLAATAGRVSARIVNAGVSPGSGRHGAVESVATLSWVMGETTGVANLSEMLTGDGVMVTGLPLAAGASESFTLVFDYPADAVGGAAMDGASAAVFDVEFSVEGDTPLANTGLPLGDQTLIVVVGAILGGILLLAVARRRGRRNT